MSILTIIIAALITTIVWFVAGAVVYMNPPVAKVFKKYQKHPSMKSWGTQGKYLWNTFLIAGLIPNILIAIVFIILAPISWVTFALILFAVRIVPRGCDMYMQTSYPNKLLVIEMVNGLILSFVTAYMLSLFI